MKTSCHVPPPIQQFPIESFLKSWPLLIFTSWCIKALSLPTAHCANLGAIPSTSFLPNQLLFLFQKRREDNIQPKMIHATLLFFPCEQYKQETNFNIFLYKLQNLSCYMSQHHPDYWRLALNVCIQTDSNSQAVNLIFLSASELTKQGCAVNIDNIGVFWVPGHVFASNFITFI